MITVVSVNSESPLRDSRIQHKLEINVGHSDPTMSLRGVANKIVTPYFVLSDKNKSYYNPYFDQLLQIMGEIPPCSYVYSDFDVYQNGKMMRVFDSPFNARYFYNGVLPNLNGMFNTKFVQNIKGPTNNLQEFFIRLAEQTVMWHIPEPLFCERVNNAA